MLHQYNKYASTLTAEQHEDKVEKSRTQRKQNEDKLVKADRTFFINKIKEFDSHFSENNEMWEAMIQAEKYQWEAKLKENVAEQNECFSHARKIYMSYLEIPFANMGIARIECHYTNYLEAIKFANIALGKDLSQEEKGLVYSYIGEQYYWLTKGEDDYAAQALLSFQKSQELFPNNSINLIRWGRFYQKAKKNDLAIEKCQEAIRTYELTEFNTDEFPTYSAMYYEALCRLGGLLRGEDSIQCYDKAISHNSQKAWAYCGKGAALNSLSRYAEAIECCAKALNYNPADGKALKEWGKALLFSKPRQPEAALKKFEAAKIHEKYDKKIDDYILQCQKLLIPNVQQSGASFFESSAKPSSRKGTQPVTSPTSQFTKSRGGRR